MPTKQSEADLCWDSQCSLGEGPLWVAEEGRFYWVDILDKTVLSGAIGATAFERHHPEEGLTSIQRSESGGWIGTTRAGFAEFTLPGGSVRTQWSPPIDTSRVRFNDGKIDRQGRYWAGTMDESETADLGALFCLDGRRTARLADEGYVIANGPAFSLAGDRMFHTDSARGVIHAITLDSDGEIRDKQVFLNFPKEWGAPDGMTVDAEDCLWVAGWGGWAVHRFSPKGERLESVRVPAEQVTSCAFGGSDLQDLIITTARVGLGNEVLAEQPHAGGVFWYRSGVPGVEEPRFAG